MKNILLLIFVFSNLLLCSQDDYMFDTYKTKALICYKKLNLDSASFYFNQAKNYGQLNQYDYDLYARSYYLVGEYKMCLNVYYESMEYHHQFPFSEHFTLAYEYKELNTSEFDSLVLTPLKNDYELISKIFPEQNKKLDSIFKLQVLSYLGKLIPYDKKNDTLINDRVVFYQEDGVYIEKSKEMDSLDFNHLITFIENNGFPTLKELNKNYFSGLKFFLYNQSKYNYGNEQWLKIIPLIKNKINKGDLPKSFLASFEDSYLYYHNKQLKYGLINNVQNYNTVKKSFYKTLKVVPLDQLNKNRKDIGLCSFELQMEYLGLDLPDILNL